MGSFIWNDDQKCLWMEKYWRSLSSNITEKSSDKIAAFFNIGCTFPHERDKEPKLYNLE